MEFRIFHYFHSNIVNSLGLLHQYKCRILGATHSAKMNADETIYNCKK